MFQPVKQPKYKRDWPGHWLSLLEGPYPQGGVSVTQVYIERRLNAMDTQNSSHDVSRWGSMRVLKVSWQCPECRAYHSGYLPESIVTEGQALFLKKNLQPLEEE